MKSQSKLALLTLACLSSSSAMAEVWFKPRIDYGLTNYQQTVVSTDIDLEDDVEGSTNETLNIDMNIITVSVGATFGIDALYLDIDYKTTQDSELHDYYSDLGTFQGSEIADNGGLDRTEMSITAGFGWEWFSLFGGYKVTSTDFEHELYLVEENNPLFVLPVSNTQTTEIVTETSFESTGLFAGVGIGFPLGENGSFAITGSYSLITKATLQDDWFREENVYDLEADGQGLSLSASIWYSFLYTKLEYAKYEYSGYEQVTEGQGGSYSDDVTEEFSRISVGLFYQF